MSNQVPDDEKDAPEWMNKEFFQDILRSSEKDDSIKVMELEAKPGSNLGDHYASVMFRAILKYNTNESEHLETSLIVKTMPFVEGAKKALLEQTGVFKVEIAMYLKVIPMFEKVLKEAKDNTHIACKCLYASYSPHQTIIFEDLTRKNFRPPPGSFDDSTFDVAMIALNKLAKWHAISFKSNADDGKISKQFDTIPFKNIEEFPLLRDGFNFLLEMLKTQPDLETYVLKFEKLIGDNLLHKAVRAYKAFANGDQAYIFVLNHGDAHLKNVMMNDTDGELDVILIDFQACNWGPAVADLIYFLYTSIDFENRIKKREEIIYTYFQTFTETLDRIGFTGEKPKLTDLYQDLLSYKDFELLMVASMLPLICNKLEMHENGDSEDLGQFVEKDDYRKRAYFKKTYIDQVRQILPDLLYKGYLD